MKKWIIRRGAGGSGGASPVEIGTIFENNLKKYISDNGWSKGWSNNKKVINFIETV